MSLSIRVVSIAVAAVVLVTAVTGCGDDDDAGDVVLQTTAPPGHGAPPGAERIKVSLNDTYIDPAQLTVRVGDTILLIVVNGGDVPHTLRLAGPDGEFETEDDVATDGPVEAGETEALTWEVLGTGELPFRCDLHPEEMVGTVTVEG